MAPIPGDSSKHQIGTSMPQGGHPPHHSITSSARPDRGSGTVPNGRCKVHGGKSTGAADAGGPRAQQASKLETRAFSRKAKAERSRVRAAILALRYPRIMAALNCLA